MSTSEIQLAYAIHDHFGYYYIYLGISMLSVMKNTDAALQFHILCDDTLQTGAKEALRQLCRSFGQKITFHQMHPHPEISTEKLLRTGYNEGVLYRLYLPELLPDCEKIIYLDADILANGDIRELWALDSSGCAAIGRWDPPLEGFADAPDTVRKTIRGFWETTDWNGYVNSGVLVMNLREIRQCCNLVEEAVAFLRKYGMVFPDQDALNYILRGRLRLMPTRFNLPSSRCSKVEKGYFYHFHYGHEESFSALDPVDQLYLSYWQQSPWANPGANRMEQVCFLKRFKNRADIYLRLHEMGKASVEDYRRLGACMYSRGEFTQALKWLSYTWTQVTDEMDETGEGRYFLLCFMSKSLQRLGRTEEAISLCEKELPAETEEKDYESRPDYGQQTKLTLGILYYERGELEKAETMFRRSLCWGTNRKAAVAETAMIYLAKCSLQKKDYASASDWNERLLFLRPEDERWRKNAVLLAGKLAEQVKG